MTGRSVVNYWLYSVAGRCSVGEAQVNDALLVLVTGGLHDLLSLDVLLKLITLRGRTQLPHAEVSHNLDSFTFKGQRCRNPSPSASSLSRQLKIFYYGVSGEFLKET